MTTKYFADTNLWLYMVDVEGDSEKSRQATSLLRRLLQNRNGVISIQVQGEFASICTRRLGLTPETVSEFLKGMEGFEVQTHRSNDIEDALRLMQRTSVSFWDALMIINAQQARCTVFLTEDLNHGQVIEGIRIHNPFLEMPKI